MSKDRLRSRYLVWAGEERAPATQARVKMGDMLHMSEESQVVTNVISCVSIFYEKGPSGRSFLRKDKF
jgi:hypothetical protein